MLTNITTRLITLAPQNGNGATHGQVTAFTGEAANAMNASFLAISTSLSQSHTPATGVKSGTTVNMARAHQEQLPKSGDRPYIPPKKGRGQPVWDANKGGFVDEYGNVWVWAKAKHGGDHWDVEHPDGSHTNVAPNGRVIGSSAKDKFPNKRK